LRYDIFGMLRFFEKSKHKVPRAYSPAEENAGSLNGTLGMTIQKKQTKN